MRKISTLVPTTSVMVLMAGLLAICFSSCERVITQPVIDTITPPETPNRHYIDLIARCRISARSEV